DSTQRAAAFAALHFRRNFAVLLVDACAFFAGLAFFDSTTVLPVLLAKVGAADWQIGLTRLIQTLGFTLPAVLAAHYIHGRATHRGVGNWERLRCFPHLEPIRIEVPVQLCAARLLLVRRDGGFSNRLMLYRGACGRGERVGRKTGICRIYAAGARGVPKQSQA